MEIHDIANIIPVMSDEDYVALRDDIATNGLREAIWLYEGKILDGRHRYRACMETGAILKYRDYDEATQGDPVAFVLSLNIARRHLTVGQRSFVGLEVKKYWEKLARENAKLSGELYGRGQAEKGSPNLAEPINPIDSRDKAAHTAKVSHTNISKAERLDEQAPDLAQRVKSGEMAIDKAAKELKKRTTPKAPKYIPEHKLMPTIYCASADDMPIDNDNVDIIVTSPPYNLGDSNWPMGGLGATPRENGIGYSDDMDELEYQAWQVRCLAEMYRVAKPGASLFYNHKVRIRDGKMIHPMDWLRNADNPWILRQECIWDRKSTHNHATTLFYPEDERIYWMTKGKPTLADHSIGYSTIWRDLSFRSNQSDHPAPFIDEIPDICIKSVIDFNAPNSHIVVLDPFMGSGTTLRVALKYGCQAIGIDLSPEYIELAKRENAWMSD